MRRNRGLTLLRVKLRRAKKAMECNARGGEIRIIKGIVLSSNL